MLLFIFGELAFWFHDFSFVFACDFNFLNICGEEKEKEEGGCELSEDC